MSSKTSQRKQSPYKAHAKCLTCDFCDEVFSSRSQQSAHNLLEKCLPKDPTERWIVKFLTLKANNDTYEYMEESFDAELEAVCGAAKTNMSVYLDHSFDAELEAVCGSVVAC